MDPIELEVKKYHQKREALTTKFLAKMKSLLMGKKQAVKEIDVAVSDLTKRKERTTIDINRLETIINETQERR